jgi:hypothetical protein
MNEQNKLKRLEQFFKWAHLDNLQQFYDAPTTSSPSRHIPKPPFTSHTPHSPCT